MSSKTNITLTLILSLAALIIIFVIWKNPLDRQTTSDVEETIITSDLDRLKKIEISKAGKPAVLIKESGQWLVASENNAAANTTLVEKLISQLKASKIGLIISSNPDKYKTFGLTEETVTKLKLFSEQDQLIIELWVGTSGGAANDQTYVKKPDSANVLLVDQQLNSAVIVQDWKQPPPTVENTNTSTNPQ